MAANQKLLMKGNEALAEAAINAGCRHFFGYPITPQTEVAAYMAKRMPQVGGTYLQAESEIAAINMVYGASSAGARVMTSSSSPGIALKAEGISYMAGADLPAVIINIQRGGPGLGGIQPSQADYNFATKAPGHGDLHILVFAPATIQELVNTIDKAFNLADEYRMPAMILGDGILGQMMEPVEFPESNPKIPDKFGWAACGHQGKRKHNIVNSLYLQAQILEDKVVERFERYKDVAAKHTEVEEYRTEDAELVIVAYGATSRIARSAIEAARAKGIKVGMVRPITLWPYPSANIARLAEKPGIQFLTVEMSMGQMVEDVRLAVNGKVPVSFFGHTGGIVPTPAEVLAQIEKLTGGAK